jgi:hypothetical protein
MLGNAMGSTPGEGLRQKRCAPLGEIAAGRRER